MPRATITGGRGRKKKQDAPLLNRPEVQQPTALDDSDHRPRTRSWYKSEAIRLQAAAAPPVAFPLTSQRQTRYLRPRKPSLPAEVDIVASHPGGHSSRTKPKENARTIKRRRAASQGANGKRIQKSSEKAGEQVKDRLIIENLYPVVTRNPSVTEWLRRVQASVSSDEPLTEQNHEPAWESSLQQMQSSGSASGTTRESVEGQSTIKGVGRHKKLDWDKLRSREVDEDPSTDERVPHFKDVLHWELPKLNTQQVEEVLAIFKSFAELTVEEVDYPQVESLSNEFDRWKSKVKLAQITEEHFLGDVIRCSFSNEAVLQRTIMMEIMDRHQLHNFLAFNSEGQWDQNHSDRLISRDADLVTLPKPDLNVSFKLDSFNKSAPIPGNLKKSFRPDSLGQKYGRCFPFLFFEVKRASHSLEVALMANLHSASQALLNIYAWMVRAQQVETFFEKVRVFTFVFNAQDLLVRMHRASRHDITLLQYHFVEFVEFRAYSKDQVCLLTRNILEKYAIEELHPILKSAFDTVTDEWSRSIQERRNTFAQATAAGRARSRGTPNRPVEDSTSFGLSALST